jgi:hypothetical protein
MAGSEKKEEEKKEDTILMARCTRMTVASAAAITQNVSSPEANA